MLAGICAVATVWLCGMLSRGAQEPVSAHADAPKESAASSLTGEFSGCVAGYLWQKADEYLHGGVLMRPMTGREEASGDKGATSGDDVHCAHEGEVTVVPSRENDCRGWWGDVERQVKPFFEAHGHKHHDPAEGIPLFRLMTWADPTFLPGYLIGAYTIRTSDHARLPEALDLLREGTTNNPTSIAMHTELGHYLFVYAKQPSVAERHLLTAIRLSHSPPKHMDPWDKEAIQQAYRWLVLLYRTHDEPDLAREWARRGIALFPDDPVMRVTLGGKPR